MAAINGSENAVRRLTENLRESNHAQMSAVWK